MTGKQLVEQILHLGAKTQLNYPIEQNAIYTAINRAIDEVNKLFPVTDTVQILHFPIAPVVYKKGIVVHKGGQDIVINASGAKSLAFTVSGTGKAIIKDIDTEENNSFDWQDESQLVLKKYILAQWPGFDGGNIELTFTGDYTYLIGDLSIYAELEGDCPEDIGVYSEYKEYELTNIKYAGTKFADLARAPHLEDDENLIPVSYKLKGSRLGLPSDKPGVYTVTYRVCPYCVNADNEKEELGCDVELQNLIAPRAAYYLYMLVDDEAADRCLREYHDLYTQYMNTHKVRPPTKFNSTRGW